MIPINTTQLYIMHNKLATISRLLFGKNAPILKESDFHNMDVDPPGPSTESMDHPITGSSYVSWDYITQLMSVNTYAETENGYTILPLITYIQTYIDMIEQLHVRNLNHIRAMPDPNTRMNRRNITYTPRPLVQNKPKPLGVNQSQQTLDERVKRILGHKVFR